MKSKQKILVIVNTYFQLMTAVQLVLKIYKEDVVDFIITDNLIGYDEISKRVEKSGIVDKVYVAESKSISIPRTRVDKQRAVFYTVFGKSFLRKKTNLSENKYDILLFHNIDVFTYIIFNELINRNNKTHVYRYEEGFSLYLTFNDRPKSEKMCEWIFKKLRRKSVVNNIDAVYLYHPEYLTYKMTQEIRKIPLLSKTDEVFKDTINLIFQYSSENNKTRKAIIFEECFYADKTPIDDYDLFHEVIQVIGPNDASIKLHPRNTTNRFSETDALVFDGGNVPWEVLQLNSNYQDNVFITITSGSVLASMLYFDESIHTVFLYKVVGGKFKLKKNYEAYLNKVCKAHPSVRIYIPKNKEEMYQILGEM